MTTVTTTQMATPLLAQAAAGRFLFSSGRKLVSFALYIASIMLIICIPFTRSLLLANSLFQRVLVLTSDSPLAYRIVQLTSGISIFPYSIFNPHHDHVHDDSPSAQTPSSTAISLTCYIWPVINNMHHPGSAPSLLFTFMKTPMIQIDECVLQVGTYRGLFLSL